MWKRLALLLPAQAAAILVNLWLAFGASSPWPVRVTCLSIATLLAGLIAYLVFQTLIAARRPRPNLQEARALRRQMRPCGMLAIASLVLLAALTGVPRLFQHHRRARADWATLPRRMPVQVVEPALPGAAPPAPGLEESLPEPAPAETIRSEPEVRPAVALEPTHLQLSERDFEFPREFEVPYLPKPSVTADATPKQESETLPFRPDRDEFRESERSHGFLFGLTVRPLPDEHDPEGWPEPELLLEGFLLLADEKKRIPGLTFEMDLPFGRDDSILASWTAAILTRPVGTEFSAKPNWNHLTLAYLRRLAGYTSRSQVDLAISMGACVDFLNDVKGVPDPGYSPRLAPYLGLDAALWQYNVVGLLLHVGESIPVTLIGSSLGVTDFNAQIRWDLTERISIHGGYRVVCLRYKYDDIASSTGVDPLRGNMTGPVLGLDIRF